MHIIENSPEVAPGSIYRTYRAPSPAHSASTARTLPRVPPSPGEAAVRGARGQCGGHLGRCRQLLGGC